MEDKLRKITTIKISTVKKALFIMIGMFIGLISSVVLILVLN